MTEQDLRDVLQRQASGLHAHPDHDAIEQRGRRLRRNRRALISAGPVAVAVIAVAVAVPLLSSSDATAHRGPGLSRQLSPPRPLPVIPARPANVETWPTRGVDPGGTTLAQAEASYAYSRGRDGQHPQARLLFGGSTGRSRFVLTQMWFEGDTSADTVGFVDHSDASPGELQLNAALAPGATVAAMDVSEPGGDLLVVVPADPAASVSYAATGTTFVPQPPQADAGGVTFVERGFVTDAHDVVRLTVGPSSTDVPVTTLLCGTSECG